MHTRIFLWEQNNKRKPRQGAEGGGEFGGTRKNAG